MAYTITSKDVKKVSTPALPKTRTQAAQSAYTQAASAYAKRMTGDTVNGMPMGALGAIGSQLTKQRQAAPGGGGGGGGYLAPGGGGDAGGGDYYAKLKAMKEAGIMSQFEADSSVIKNNLAKAFANMKAEKAALAPIYQNQLTQATQNQFTSGEAMKEMMNQSGWNGQNSGIAIGEQGKIKIGADNARAEASSVYGEGVADANRRMTLAQQVSDEEMGGLERWKSAQLRGAEAEAWVANQDRMDQVTAARQDYAAKLASASSRQATTNATTLTKAQAAQAKQTSSTARRQLSAELAGLYNKGNLAELIRAQSDIARDDQLSDDDFEDLNNKLATMIDNLKKNKPATDGTVFNMAD